MKRWHLIIKVDYVIVSSNITFWGALHPCIYKREMILWNHGIKVKFHTTTKDKPPFPVSYSTILVSKHPFFWNLHSLSPKSFLLLSPEAFSLLHWFSAPPQLCPHEAMDWIFILSLQLILPQRFFLYWSSVPPKLSPHEAMAWLMFEGVGVGVGLMFERIDFRSDFGLKIWVLFEFGNGFKFDVWSWGLIVFVRVWLILWGFGNNKNWTFGWLGIKLVGFNIFLTVWLILVEIGNNKVWFF